MYKQVILVAVTACMVLSCSAAPLPLEAAMEPSAVPRNLILVDYASGEFQDVLTSKGLETPSKSTGYTICTKIANAIHTIIPLDSIKDTLESVFNPTPHAEEENSSCYNLCLIKRTLRAWLTRSPSHCPPRVCTTEGCPPFDPCHENEESSERLVRRLAPRTDDDIINPRPCEGEGCPSRLVRRIAPKADDVLVNPRPCPVEGCPGPPVSNPRPCEGEGCPSRLVRKFAPKADDVVINPRPCPVEGCPDHPTPAFWIRNVSPKADDVVINPRPCPVEGCPEPPTPTASNPRPCEGEGCPERLVRYFAPRDIPNHPCPLGAVCPGIPHQRIDPQASPSPDILSDPAFWIRNVAPRHIAPNHPCPLDGVCPGLPHQTISPEENPLASPAAGPVFWI